MTGKQAYDDEWSRYLGRIHGVREYAGDGGDDLFLVLDKQTGRLCIEAWTECGNANTRIDAMDLLAWLRTHPLPEAV